MDKESFIQKVAEKVRKYKEDTGEDQTLLIGRDSFELLDLEAITLV